MCNPTEVYLFLRKLEDDNNNMILKKNNLVNTLLEFNAH